MQTANETRFTALKTRTCDQLITRSLAKVQDYSNGKAHIHDWSRHPVAVMVKALAAYADSHRQRFGCEIGEDGVLGDGWLSMARGVIVLLNGETGGLDCGTVDGLVRDMARLVKFSDEEVEGL